MIDRIHAGIKLYTKSISSDIKEVHRTKDSLCNKKINNRARDTLELSSSYKYMSQMMTVDTGTAKDTTVYVGRLAFEQIVKESTYGSLKWEELGGDDEKRWVVINGQRFECEHSPQEKALRKQIKEQSGKTLLDYIEEHFDKDEFRKQKQDKGNVEKLKSNSEVMKMLSRIFGCNGDDVFSKLFG